MKLKEIDNLNEGDKIVFVKESGRMPQYKVGSVLTFLRYDDNDLKSASTIYMKDSNNKLVAFGPSVCKLFEPLSVWRDKKIDLILND